MTANGRHLAISGRRGTPIDIVERSRRALGGRIELDPMSEPAFNKVVRAERIWTASDDCFKQSWACDTMFLNPHGGLVIQAWRDLCMKYTIGTVRSAIWIGFAVEQLNLLANEEYHPDDFSKLTMRQRLDFTTTEPLRAIVHPRHSTEMAILECGHDAAGKASRKSRSGLEWFRCTKCVCEPEPLGNPTGSNYICGLGIETSLFEAAFAGLGRFHHGRYAVRAEEDLFGGSV